MQIEFVQPFGDKNNYNVRINNVYCGALEVKEDGYWDWWPNNGRSGYIPAWVLHVIANKLDELNAPWDAIVQAQCSSTP
jgi:hypothetical protein